MIFEVNKLNWLYFDFDSYFASVEQQLNPALRGKPIVVVPMLSDSTCAIAASYEAKKFGIQTGAKIYEAKKLCPELICVPSNHSAYSRFHNLLINTINKQAYVDHVFSIDEGACKLTGKLQELENAKELATKVKLAIKTDIGEFITCSIGIAPSRFLAKIASNIVKPNGVTVINTEEIKTVLCQLNLRDLPGIGRATFNKLSNANITSVQQLYQLESGHLQKLWGSVVGKRYWYYLRGVDIAKTKEKTITLGQSKVLSPKERPVALSRNIVQKLILKAAKRLREKKLCTSKVALRIYDTSRNKFKESKKIPALCDSRGLSSAVLSIWDELVYKYKINQVKKIAITFYNLAGESPQLSLFDIRETKKQQTLSKIMDAINLKYNANVVTIGIKEVKKEEQEIIAFKRIPITSQ
ncbi:MAG: DNA-directed DNA polymerase [Rickettsiaceae bacterium]|nr:DNA-directed DNA polymerase [Rickettsiaceae bacterium]